MGANCRHSRTKVFRPIEISGGSSYAENFGGQISIAQIAHIEPKDGNYSDRVPAVAILMAENVRAIFILIWTSISSSYTKITSLSENCI